MKGSLKQLTREHLPKVLSWRNSNRVRKNMYNEKIITMEEHLQWFHQISQSKTNRYFLFFLGEAPIGLVSFNDISDQHAHCKWGFYIGEENAGPGSGTLMAVLAFDYIFQKLKLNKVYGEVLTYNHPSIRFHEKLGFQREGYFKSHIRKNEKFFDVVCYGLLKKDWDEKYKPSIVSELKEKGIDGEWLG